MGRRIQGLFPRVGRPKALDKSNADLARRMHAAGEPVKTIADTLRVSQATIHRVVAED
jgi:DNA invertase Pin-like site-specific DNA recombinase